MRLYKNQHSIRKRGHAGRLSFRREIIGFLVVVCLVSAIRLALYGFESVRTYRQNAQLREIYEPNVVDVVPITKEREDIPTVVITEPPTDYQYIGNKVSSAFAELYDVNPDLIGWLTIPGVVDLPVVYRDNAYYLTHDFYGHKNKAGTLFLDVGHPLGQDTRYLLIHGHSMHDGSMFGLLTHYRQQDYMQAHPRLTLKTLYSIDNYEIIGSCVLSVEEMFSVARMGKPCFDDDAEFEAFIENLRAHSRCFTEEEIPSDSVLLALATCRDNGRIVVFFRRIASEPYADS